MTTPTTNLYMDDMFVVLPNISDNIVDLAVIDLPYGTMDCSWDNKVNLEQLWSQLHRVSTNTATWIFFCDMKLAVELILSNRAEYRFELIWDKVINSSFFSAKKRPLIKHEFMLVFTRHKSNYTYCLDGHNIINTRVSDETRNAGGCYKPKKSGTHSKNYYDPPLPRSILEFKKNRKRGLHPTEKPAELYEWIIQYFSREGNTILDPCFGSGNSGIVAKRMGRNYIGIEMDPVYFQKASDNILA